MKTNHSRGLVAELVAALLLQAKCYRIIAKRQKTPVGEIDIIASRGNTLAIIEVKLRGNMDSSLESVSTRQRQRLERAAGYYLAGKPQYINKTVRFDFIALAPWRMPRHIISAWEAEEK